MHKRDKTKINKLKQKNNKLTLGRDGNLDKQFKKLIKKL